MGLSGEQMANQGPNEKGPYVGVDGDQVEKVAFAPPAGMQAPTPYGPGRNDPGLRRPTAADKAATTTVAPPKTPPPSSPLTPPPDYITVLKEIAKSTAKSAAMAASIDARFGSSFQAMDPKVLTKAMTEAVEMGVQNALKAGKGKGSAPSGGSGLPGLPGLGGGGGGQRRSSQSSLNDFGMGLSPGGYQEGEVSGSSNWSGGGIGGLRRGVTSSVGQKISEFGRSSWAPPVDTHVTKDALGNITKTYTEAGTQNILPADTAETMISRGRVLDAVKGGLTGLGEGGVGAGIEGAAMAVPGLDIAAAAALAIPEGIHIVTSQRASNAQYQSVLGGSNVSQFRQRASAEGFKLSSMGDLSGGQASELFQGTTSLGLKGGERNNANQTAKDLYNDLGMSISQSLDAITIAATSGNRQLTNLSDSIKLVSEAAVSAGVNANTARQQFIQTYQQYTAAGIQGTQAPIIAAATVAAATNSGLQGSKINTAGLTTSGASFYEAAAQSGLTPAQQTIKQNGPGGANFIANQQEKMAQQTIVQLIGAAGWAGCQAIALNYLKAAGGDKTALDNQWYPMAAEAVSKGYIKSDPVSEIIPWLATQGITNVGSGMDALEWIMKLAVGKLSNQGWNVATQAAKLQGASQVSNLNNKSVTVKKDPSAGVGSTTTVSGNKAVESAISQMTGGGAGTGSNADAAAGQTAGAQAAAKAELATIKASSGSDLGATRAAYVQDILDKGKQDPILAKLIGNKLTRNALYQVKVKGGTKIVNAHELVANFADQVQSEDGVKIMTGSEAGDTIGMATGMQPDTKQKVTSDQMTATRLKTLKIKTYDPATVAKSQSTAATVGGSIKITATPALQKYLQMINQTTVSNTPNVGNVTPRPGT
jgi:hypothetical protein